MAHYFLLYILKCSLDRTEPMYEAKTATVRVAWKKVVLANNRSEALLKCSSEIKALFESRVDKSIKVLSVYVGKRYGVTEKADRLAPIQMKFFDQKELTAFDLCPSFGSYLNDMESCLQRDAEAWKKYSENAVPFISDMLCDFGTFPPEIDHQDYEAVRKVADRAAQLYVHGK